MGELCGIISGDGNIWTNYRKYEITITGNPKDGEYMDSVAAYLKEVVKPKVYYRIRGRGLRVSIYSKAFFVFLTKGVGFGIGVKKNTAGIPQRIMEEEILRRGFIRGLFDTDGSIFTSDKKGVHNYPTIEITNENLLLLEQVREILGWNGFRTTIRKSNKGTYKVAIHGKRMIRRWSGIIGSSHPRKQRKMESIIKSID
ncbi:hypothetical protein L0Y65_06805 [Candidatus Micrarchaeota archaeon]|nr:hypothetical protein [Candidatus Micrarchaeota archaeon]